MELDRRTFLILPALGAALNTGTPVVAAPQAASGR